MDTDVEVGALKASNNALTGRVDRIEQSIEVHMGRIYKKLEVIGNRPSWLTLSIISFLSSCLLSIAAVELARLLK